MATTLQPPVSLGDVLDAEHIEINKVRAKRHPAGFERGKNRKPAPAPAAPIAETAPVIDPEWDTKWVDVTQQAHMMNLTGLAFSGGGIRSASFNLGVLQALADLKLLFRVDYLSTVSGGGYIGAWLAAWTKRVKSFARVQEEISTHRVNLNKDKEQPPVRFLRVFSNYLTPKLGVFSGDTWAMIAIYLRNLLLNQTIIMALLATLLLLPRVALAAFDKPHVRNFLLGAEPWMLLAALVMILINVGYLDAWKRKGAPRLTEQKWVLLLVCLPLIIAAAAAALRLELWFQANTKNPSLSWIDSARYGAIGYSVLWGLASLVSLIFGKWIQKEKFSTLLRILGDWAVRILATLCAGAFAGWLYALLASYPELWQDPKDVLTFGVPLVVGVFLLIGALHIGLMGTLFHDWKREWWGRLGGWLMFFAILWLVFFWLALCFPDFIRSHPELWSGWKAWAMKSLTPAWILSTIGTVMGAKSKDTGKPGASTWIDVAIKVGPYVFIAGLLCWISYGLDYFLTKSEWKSWGFDSHHHHFGILVIALAVCFVVTLVMAQRVDINLFSMHLFYRNRLVRCFLGASNGVGSHSEPRTPNRFTGFDAKDDMPLKDLRSEATDSYGPYDGPYPVINMALNLVKGKDLAWQERKAESFVMTPLYCGYDVWLEEQDSPMLTSDRGPSNKLEHCGYRSTAEYAFAPPRFHGPNLGLAMAISGAAASPNMGCYSSAPVAFLMTVFNVRLGQWLGNPRHRTTSGRPTPYFGLGCLINEMLGGTDDEARYVYLSDGGHFENMGLYELVKRRCGLIILCDAEEDAGYTFSGLGNAIRKCRIDMGIDIDLDTSAIVPDKTSGLSKQHCAVGTIHYENADKDAPTGTIIYFKASLTGNESADVKDYKNEHQSFPHESTVNQWFSESQFESYRQLGYEIVSSAIRNTPSVPLNQTGKTLREHFEDFGA